MDPQAAELATAIGVRVRHERQARRWTLDQLADWAGVSRRALVNVEQGAANPSVGTLLRISDALGIGLPALVEPPAGRPLKVTRAGEGAALWTGDGGGRGVLMAGSAPPRLMPATSGVAAISRYAASAGLTATAPIRASTQTASIAG